MTQAQDTCPVTDSGNHRYFIFKAVEVFEPFIDIDLEATGKNGKYYEKVEYAISGCNCGSVVKQKVKQQ